jgi:hypothetical protein
MTNIDKYSTHIVRLYLDEFSLQNCLEVALHNLEDLQNFDLTELHSFTNITKVHKYTGELVNPKFRCRKFDNSNVFFLDCFLFVDYNQSIENTTQILIETYFSDVWYKKYLDLKIETMIINHSSNKRFDETVKNHVKLYKYDDDIFQINLTNFF